MKLITSSQLIVGLETIFHSFKMIQNIVIFEKVNVLAFDQKQN